MKIKKILLPVDFSEFTDKAVDTALLLGEKLSADITLLHAVVLFQEDRDEAAQLRQYEEITRQKEDQLHRILEGCADDCKDKGVKIHSQLVRGFSTADAILEFNDETPHDLIVIGAHGRTGLKRWLYGSVAEKIVRHSPIPVLTTRPELKDFACNTILAAVDFSDNSKEACEFAIDLGKKFSAKITFVHVVEQRFHPAFYAGNVKSIFALDPQLNQRIIEELKKITGDRPEFKHVVLEGIANKEIVDYAGRNNSDLIIMGTQGLTGLEQLMVGSTTEKVIRTSPAPVMTIGWRK